MENVSYEPYNISLKRRDFKKENNNLISIFKHCFDFDFPDHSSFHQYLSFQGNTLIPFSVSIFGRKIPGDFSFIASETSTFFWSGEVSINDLSFADILFEHLPEDVQERYSTNYLHLTSSRFNSETIYPFIQTITSLIKTLYETKPKEDLLSYLEVVNCDLGKSGKNNFQTHFTSTVRFNGTPVIMDFKLLDSRSFSLVQPDLKNSQDLIQYFFDLLPSDEQLRYSSARKNRFFIRSFIQEICWIAFNSYMNSDQFRLRKAFSKEHATVLEEIRGKIELPFFLYDCSVERNTFF